MIGQFNAKIYNYLVCFNSCDSCTLFLVIFSVLFLGEYLINRKVNCKECVRIVAFSLWSTIVLIITVMARQEGCINSWDTMMISFAELSQGQTGILYDMIFNVIMFIPGGVIIGMSNRFIKTVTLTFFFSIIIELIQLITRRGIFELSDILFNTIGGICGAVFVLCIKKGVGMYNG